MSAIQTLRHRDFRLYFAGQTVSMVGTWMQNLAMGWMVYRITGEPRWLGLVYFASQGMAFLFSPLAGQLSDRMRLRNLVMGVQVLALIQGLAMTALAWHPGVRIWQVMALSMVLGALTAFDLTGRQVLVARTVPAADLPSAIALHSATFHGSRIVGPALAGVVLARLGEGWCFLFNAISYLAALAALACMRVGNEPPEQAPGRKGGGIMEGVAYLKRDRRILLLTLFLGFTVLLGMPYTSLMPVFARTLLNAGPEALSWIMGAGGVGATLGALVLAHRKGLQGLEKVLIAAGIAFPLALTAFAFSRTLWLSSLLMGVSSLCLVTLNTGNSTLVQTSIPAELRGRVMAVYGMVFILALPLAALWGGYTAQHLGADWTLALGSAGCLAATLGFAFSLRRMGTTAEANLRQESTPCAGNPSRPPEEPAASDR